MKANRKKILLFLVVAGGALMSYFLWLTSCPVEIVAVHENGNHSYVLVKKLPFTDKGKINWWLGNKDMLKDRYKIPKPDTDGFFTVVFWDFSNGYKEKGKYDRLCFDDMKLPINCIEKNKIFSVSNSRNMGISFVTHDEIYRMRKSGEIVKDKSD